MLKYKLYVSKCKANLPCQMQLSRRKSAPLKAFSYINKYTSSKMFFIEAILEIWGVILKFWFYTVCVPEKVSLSCSQG